MKLPLALAFLFSAFLCIRADGSPFEFREVEGKAGVRYLLVTHLNDETGVTFFFPHGAQVLAVSDNSRLVVDNSSRRKSELWLLEADKNGVQCWHIPPSALLKEDLPKLDYLDTVTVEAKKEGKEIGFSVSLHRHQGETRAFSPTLSADEIGAIAKQAREKRVVRFGEYGRLTKELPRTDER